MAKAPLPPAYRPCPTCQHKVLYAEGVPFAVSRPVDARQGDVYWVVLNGDNETFRAVPVSGATVGYRRHRCGEEAQHG